MLTVILRSGRRPRLEGWRPGLGRRPPISALPEIGTIARKSATADLRWLASLAPQGDGKESVINAVGIIRSPDDCFVVITGVRGPIRRVREVGGYGAPPARGRPEVIPGKT